MLELLVGAVVPLHPVVVARVVAVVAGRLRHRHEPDAGGAEVAGGAGVPVIDVVELRREAGEVADPVAVAVGERANEDLVADRAPGPGGRRGLRRRGRSGAGGERRDHGDGSSVPFTAENAESAEEGVVVVRTHAFLPSPLLSVLCALRGESVG